MNRLFAIGFALLVGAWSSTTMAGAPPHDCTPPPDGDYGISPSYTYTTVYVAPKYPKGYTDKSCGDANRGKMLYENSSATGGWGCFECHSPSPLTDTQGGMPQILLRGAPRDPGYIANILPTAPGGPAVWGGMAQSGCGDPGGGPPFKCLADREPGNVMGDLGDIAEYLYTCDLGIAPCVGGGGTSPGALQGPAPINFGNVNVGSTSAGVSLTLTNIGSTTVNVASVTSSNAAEFAIVTSGCAAVVPSDSCAAVLTFRPAAAGARSTTVTVTSDGQGNPQAFTLTGTGVAGANYEGLWWVDKGAENGWGVNIAHQGDSVFVTWYTYDTSGNAWWLSMLGTKVAGTPGTFSGPILLSHGSAFDASPFVPSTNPASAGNGTLTFADGSHASFDYTVNGVHQVKAIVRFDLGTGPLPSCTEMAAPDYASASNYQNLWWAQGGGESGWGINLIHQGDSIFATWYTYDANGLPLWLSALMGKTGPGAYSGPLVRTSGPRFDAYVGPPANSDAGTLALTFANGNLATMRYTVKNVAPGPPVTQSKQITRFVYGSSPTLCQ